MAQLAKYPIIATEINLINCFEGFNLDSLNTMYRVIKKLTMTPKKKDIANDTV